MSQGVERYRVAIVAVLGALIVAGGVALWIGRPRPGPIMISTPVDTPTPVPEPSSTAAPLRVYVSGAVAQPDVYTLPPKSIVKDAISAAGGATVDADLERVNLAVQLYDQQQVHIPRKGEKAPTVTSRQSDPATGPPQKVNINTASVEELDALPGIGPAIAQRIVDYRDAYGEFAAIEDIMNVKGIGPATFADLEAMIAVR